MADVIAMIVADGMATYVWYGRYYYYLADVMANRMEWLADVKANMADGITTGSFCLFQF